jgi:hypothetical protein
LKDEAAIVGIGQTEFSKNSGRSELSSPARPVRAALEDCGVKPRDVDGLVTFSMDTNDEVEVAQAVGLRRLTFYSRIPLRRRRRDRRHPAGGHGRWPPAWRSTSSSTARSTSAPGRRYSTGIGEGIVTADLDPLELVPAVRPSDSRELGGDVHAALHARVRP